MGWNNPNVPWSELERALSGRAPAPGKGPLKAIQHWQRHRPDPPPLPAGPTTRVPYAELHCHSAFSFLDGASTPEQLVAEAVRLGLNALAITDHDGLYGIVRFNEAAREAGLRTLFGAELTLGPGPVGERHSGPGPVRRQRSVTARPAGARRVGAPSGSEGAGR